MTTDRKVATIVFFSPSHQVLLQDREGISKFGEKWGFFGGSIEEGESPIQALMREINEELSFDLEQFDFFKQYSGIFPNGQTVIANVFIGPLPPLSRLVQTEGKSMRLFSFLECRSIGLLDLDKKILSDIEKALSSR